MKIDRIYHPWDKLEEVKANMWGEAEDRKDMLAKAIKFTGDHKLYGSFMRRVIVEWPISCENALTDHSLNKKAWIGHAACAMAISCPEDITREAWGHLTDGQQLLANKEAARALQSWENAFLASRGISDDMGGQVLF